MSEASRPELRPATGAVLVTGAAGFIGRVVVRKLAESGRQVIGTDVVAPAASEAATFAVADVRDVLRHTALLAGGGDGIIHCGGISGPMLAGDNPAELIDVNVRSTTTLLELTRALGLRRFIGCSLVSAYGDLGTLDPVDEATPLRASTVYGSSKAMGISRSRRSRPGLACRRHRCGSAGSMAPGAAPTTLSSP